MARGIRLGFEDYDNAEISDELALVEDPSDTVEAHLVEVADDTIADAVEAVDLDQLGSDMVSLVDHARNVEDSMAEGGLDPIAARSTELAVESIAKRWGIKRQKMGFESFQGSGRGDATRLAFEGIVDTVREGASRVWKWILQKIDQIQQAWAKFSNAGKSAKKRIEKLRDRVKNLRGTRDTNETIEGKKIYKLASTKAALEKVVKLDRAAFNNGGDALNSMIAAELNEAATSLTSDDPNIKLNGTKIDIGQLENAKLVWTIGGSERKFASLIPPSAKREGIHIGLTYGGVVIAYKDGDDCDCLTYKEMTVEQVEDYQAPVLETSAMTNMLDMAFDTASALDQYYQKMSKVQTQLRKLKEDISRKQRNFDKEFDKKNVDSNKVSDKRKEVYAAKAKFESAVELENMYRRTAVNMIQGVTTYVTESMKHYSTED
ncbi:MAG: hypothetical protein ACRDDY_13800 [Clostridium sp.]|uniref:hypothetical protein n=1 Tax=Clostridium sp. TaxID=1506 RepID=UPI003EE469D7